MSKNECEKDVRRMYRLSWSDGRYKECFCQECVDEPLRQEYIQKSSEVSTGVCHSCDYERNKEVISKEKALFIENEIKEMKRLIEKISSSEREVRIDQILLHRVKEYGEEVTKLPIPITVRQSLQFPIRPGNDAMISIIEKHIENLKLKKEEILN